MPTKRQLDEVEEIIDAYHPNIYLCGRGGPSNAKRSGNKLVEMIENNLEAYRRYPRLKRRQFARTLLDRFVLEGGQLLSFDEDEEVWKMYPGHEKFHIWSDIDAIEKTIMQMLRDSKRRYDKVDNAEKTSEESKDLRVSSASPFHRAKRPFKHYTDEQFRKLTILEIQVAGDDVEKRKLIFESRVRVINKVRPGSIPLNEPTTYNQTILR